MTHSTPEEIQRARAARVRAAAATRVREALTWAQDELGQTPYAVQQPALVLQLAEIYLSELGRAESARADR